MNADATSVQFVVDVCSEGEKSEGGVTCRGMIAMEGKCGVCGDIGNA